MCMICVTGMRGSGKTVFGEIAISSGYKIYEMRTIVEEMMVEQNIKIDNVSMREFAKDIRERYGKDIVARKMISKLEKESSKNILIVGIRGMYEIRRFREAFGDKKVLLLSIHSSPKARYDRVLKRKHKIDDPANYDEFLWSEEMELGYGISKAIALSDEMIVNNSDLDSYIESCKDFLNKHKVKK
jgi:dephospho-CoA kinase